MTSGVCARLDPLGLAARWMGRASSVERRFKSPLLARCVALRLTAAMAMAMSMGGEVLFWEPLGSGIALGSARARALAPAHRQSLDKNCGKETARPAAALHTRTHSRFTILRFAAVPSPVCACLVGDDFCCFGERTLGSSRTDHRPTSNPPPHQDHRGEVETTHRPFTFTPRPLPDPPLHHSRPPAPACSHCHCYSCRPPTAACAPCLDPHPHVAHAVAKLSFTTSSALFVFARHELLRLSLLPRASPPDPPYTAHTHLHPSSILPPSPPPLPPSLALALALALTPGAEAVLERYGVPRRVSREPNRPGRCRVSVQGVRRGERHLFPRLPNPQLTIVTTLDPRGRQGL